MAEKPIRSSGTHPRITPSPPPGPLTCGQADFKAGVVGYRPGGTKDWLLAYTKGGRAFFCRDGRTFYATAGVAVLVRPGTPHDYGVDNAVGRWNNVWSHFIPRSEALSWMDWPEVLPGHYSLSAGRSDSREIGRTLEEACRIYRGSRKHRVELAMNFVERALLLLDELNPKHTTGARDERISKAVEAINEDIAGLHTVDGLARISGLGRSQFCELFRRDTGMSPRDYVELRRLMWARDLLLYTSRTIGEISDLGGFENAFYFSLRFKKYFGKSPRFYRRAVREATVTP